MNSDFMNKALVFFKKIFSVSFCDSHIIIYIFGIRIRMRFGKTTPDLSLKENGLNSECREPRVILSLTSFPARANVVPKTIRTLLKQTFKPDMVILWLAEEQFPNKEKDLPVELLELQDYGLTIKWTNDTRSYKKLIPCMKEYPNDIIITFDDDIYYPNNVVELLYNSYLKNPNCIHTNRARRLDLKDSKIVSKSSAENFWLRFKKPSFFNKITGCGGVLYPPNSLNEKVLDEKAFKEIVPTQDDVWFWAMALLNRTKIQLVASYDIQLPTVESSQECGLSKINAADNIGIDSLDASVLIAEKFPDVKRALEEEYNG